MPVLIELVDGHKAYGGRVVLADASVSITDTMKVGVVGRNGAGKSTLCRILVGEEEADGGELRRSTSLRLGYLRQHDPFLPGETALQFLLRDSGQPEWRCGEVAARFEVKGERLAAPLDSLSGGWRTRVKLAALLLHEPNLLVLDEPTNFLDLRTQLLLQGFLAGFRGAALVVSHDRGFLRAVCDHTLEVSRGGLILEPGDIDAWMERASERRLHAERVNAAVEAKRRQLQRFIDSNRANASTATQAKSKAKQMARLEGIEITGDERRAVIRVPEIGEPRRGPALRCDDLAIGYGDRRVADDIRVEVEHGQRVAVVGDNGEGKTTFLRTVAGSLPPLAGAARWGHGCRTGLYAQHVYSSLPGERTVIQHLHHAAADGLKTQDLLDIAGAFLFSGDDVEKPISVLSGGERARLALAGLLVGGHNVLILDEPGNHLDVETLESLAAALRTYRGTVLFTSHDRAFVAAIATAVVEVRSGRVTTYPGDWQNYLWRVQREIDDGQRGTAPPRSAPAAAATSTPAAAGRRAWELQKRSASAEKRIAQYEAERDRLDAALADCQDTAAAEALHRDRERARERLERATAEWMEAQEELGRAGP